MYAKHSKKIFCVQYCTKVLSKEKSLSKTVLLPITKFPLRLESKKLIERDLAISNSSAFSQLYEWQWTNLIEPEFILHDGPPYANGLPHMGHVINKVLKDVILRCKILQKQKVHYVPGWDCHGLPIELKAITKTKIPLTPLQIREKARNFAEQTVDKQKKMFKSWGIIGNWESAYTTYSASYAKKQIRLFYELYTKKLMYRDLKPVFWSPSTQTALAEAELEYNSQHISTAVIIKIMMKKIPQQLEEFRNSSLYALIWTTTPWTLPSNQAICYNPDLSYSVVCNSNGDHYILATNLVQSVSNSIRSELRILKSFQGNVLNTATYIHPFVKSVELIFIPDKHATESKGTGLVHTAPAHGPEDFLVALRNNLPLTCMVDERGCYTSEAGPKLENLFVLTDGTRAVLDEIENELLLKEPYVHSYPYDWRTKQPVILRASKQWFIDTDRIKERAVELLNDVAIIPRSNSEIYRHHFVTQLQKRPYWCISRQRTWGIPIPVFYENITDEPIINRDIIENLCKLIDKHGTDYWWTLSVEELLPDSCSLNRENINKGQDILDIWFDSGISWSNVLQGEQVADMYVEGADQFTGWFQSSLLTSVALRDKAPYKTIYVHGFALDEKGLKMSKSLGNVIDPQNIMQGSKGKKAYGVDTLRWWVACHANQDSTAHVTNNVLQASADEVQKVRSVLRFALSALHDYKDYPVSYDSLKLIDKYMLHLLWNFQTEVSEYLLAYQFNKICTTVINLVTNPVSALYYNAVKDRLYCDSVDSISRRSAQYVLQQILYVVTRSVAPIVPHLAEELFLYLPNKSCESFFQTDGVDMPDGWKSASVKQVMEHLLNIKKDINKNVGASTLDKSVELSVSQRLNAQFEDVGQIMDLLCAELTDIYQVAEVHITENQELIDLEYAVNVEKTNMNVCNRCRKFSSNFENMLCNRCSLIIETFNNKVASVVYHSFLLLLLIIVLTLTYSF